MTREEILLLPARRLDALVAKFIEGLPVVWAPDPHRVPDRRLTNHHGWINGIVDGRHYDWEPVKRYSTDWSAMKRVIEAMYKHGWGLHFWSSVSTNEALQNCLMYFAEFKMIDSLDGKRLPEDSMQGEDGPLVVVRAALWRMAGSIESLL